MPLKLKAANTGDIEEIGRLGKIVWNQHYPSLITQAQIDYMLDLMYSPKALTEQLSVKGHRFYLLQDEGKNIGFVSVSPEAGNSWFLHKFYIDQQQAGKGMGAAAFEELKKTIQPSKVTLTVNRQNFKSVNFYFKLGFKIERVADVEIGNGYVMDDFVMVWTAR